jgi:MFS family permease
MTRRARPYAGLMIVCLGALVGPLDSAVNIAFPAITASFALAVRDIQWVVIAYVYAQLSLSMVFGRLGDVYGHRRIFTFAMVGCAAAHLAVGYAPSYEWLVGLRVFQGIAVGAAMACAPALATLMFEASLKRRVLGVYVTMISLGAALGPLMGGVLVEWLGWPGVFWVRVPLALCVLMLLPLVPDARAGTVHAESLDSRAVCDWRGSAYLALTLGLLILLVTGARGDMAGLSGPVGTVIILVAWLTSVALFVRHQQRASSPVLRVEPFRSRAFSVLQLASVVINLACFSIMLLMPYVLIGTSASTVAAGALLASFPAGALVGGALSARLAISVSSPQLVCGGLFIAALGLMATAALVGNAAPAALVLALACTGVGLGAFQVGYIDLTTSMLPPQERGVAGSLVNITRLVGVILGASGVSRLYDVVLDFAFTVAMVGAGLLVFAIVYTAACGRRVNASSL